MLSVMTKTENKKIPAKPKTPRNSRVATVSKKLCLVTADQCCMMRLSISSILFQKSLSAIKACYLFWCQPDVSPTPPPLPQGSFSLISANGVNCNGPGAHTLYHLTEARVGRCLSSHFCTGKEPAASWKGPSMTKWLHSRTLEGR